MIQGRCALEPVEHIGNVVSRICAKGVRLWSENGRLHYESPRGVLTQEEFDRLKTSKAEIVALLEGARVNSVSAPPLERRRLSEAAPLSYQQLAHWNLYELQCRPAIRQMAAAETLCGNLDLEALRSSLREVVNRHEVLRTRFAICEGTPMQEILESVDCRIDVEDLTALPGSDRDLVIANRIDELILEPIDVSVAPLLGARVLKIGPDEHVLIVVMEHMISDAYSMNVFLRDLFETYLQTRAGRVVSLPRIPVQFADFALWQRKARNWWNERFGSAWKRRFGELGRLRFPEDEHAQAAARRGWGHVSVRIDSDLKKELRNWCRSKGTTLVMTVFTAYAALVLRWCNASCAAFQFQIDGRFDRRLENTMGYFACALYLRIDLSREDDFVDLLRQIMEEYYKAYERVDGSYLESRVPRPQLSRNCAFNWVPQQAGIELTNREVAHHGITCAPYSFDHPMLKTLERDNEPVMLLYDGDQEVIGGVQFPLNRFSVEMMERFVRNFSMFLQLLVRQPATRVDQVLLG